MVTHAFYADDTFTQQVGTRIVNSCFGVVNQVYGDVTTYVKHETSACGGENLPPVSRCYVYQYYDCDNTNSGRNCTNGIYWEIPCTP